METWVTPTGHSSLFIKDIQQRFPATFELNQHQPYIGDPDRNPLGVQAAVHKDTWYDHIVRIISVGGVSVPIFCIGIILIYLLYFKLKLLFRHWGGWRLNDIPPKTITGMYTVDSLLTGNLERPFRKFEISCSACDTLMFSMLAPILRITRKQYARGNEFQLCSYSHFTRLALPIGLSIKNVLRNSLLPVVTSIGQYFVAGH